MACQNETEIVSNIDSSYIDDKVSASLLPVGICGVLLLPVTPVILYLMLFVYKTYKTTFQRFIIYYVVLSLWFNVSVAVLIVGAFTDVNGKWICNVQQYLLLSSQFAWYTYITAFVNFSLLFTIRLTRVRGKSLSKQSSRFLECIYVLSAVATGLTMASIEQIYSLVNGVNCTVSHFLDANQFAARFWGTSQAILFGMDLDMILVSISLCVVFCFIRQRIRNRQTAVLLRNSVIHVAIYAAFVGLDFFRMVYNIYVWSKISSCELSEVQDRYHTVTAIILAWNAVAIFVIGISVIAQAVLCIQTSTEGNTCCERCRLVNQGQRYTAIDEEDTAATNPASSRVSQPSYTNFPVPYTGGFTQITASIKFDDGDKESEQRPLVECVD